MSNNKKAGLVLVAALAAVALIAVAVMAGFNSSPAGMAQAAQSGPGADVNLSEDTKEDLTISFADLYPGAKCDSRRFSRNSISGDGLYSDSVSTPFKAKRPQGILEELKDENCQSPTLLDMNVKAFASMEFGDFSVADANPWIQEFLDKAEQYDGGLTEAFLMKETSDGPVLTTGDMRGTAAMLNVLIDRFEVAGIGSWMSTANYHLPGGNLAIGKNGNDLPRVQFNDKQEDFPALRLELTEKGHGCFYAMGYNLRDKRWEEFDCKPHTPTTTPPTVKKTPPGKPPKTTPPAPPKTPPTKPPKTPPPTNPPSPKNPKDHPANNGNGPKDQWEPAKPVTEKPSAPGGGTPPPTYKPEPVKPKPSPRPTPPPPVESSAPKPDKPEPSPTKDPCKANPDLC